MKRQFQSKAVPRGTRTIWRYLSALFILFTFAIGNVWAAASSVIPSSPDYKDISTVATSGTYTFTCSSSNIKDAASATSSWIGWYSTQSSFKEYDKDGSATCMGTKTKIPNLKYDKVYFYVTNCTSFEVQAWANGSNRHVNYSYQATDATSATADSFTSANNETCASSGEIELDASKYYEIIVWNDATEEIGVTYMVFNTSTGGGSTDPVSSVTVAGAATGYATVPVELTATPNKTATAYKWFVDGVEQSGKTSATFNFEAATPGTYSIVAKARNDYNTEGEWIASDAHTVTVSKLCGELVKIVLTGNKDGNVSGILTGTKDVSTSTSTSTYESHTGYKLGGNGQYVGITGLSKPLRAADVVTVYVTSVSANLILYSDKGTTKIGEKIGGVTQGANDIVLTSAATGKTAIYLYRVSTDVDEHGGGNMNPFVYSLSVNRSCEESDDCSIADVTINGESVTPAGKVYSYEVAAASALTEVAVTYSTHPLATANPASGFKVAVPSAGDPANTQTITVTAEDGTHSDTYTVSVTKAATASDVVTLDALAVTGYTLDPTFDAATLAYTITKAYGTADPTADKVTFTKSEEAQSVDVVYDGTNHKFVVTVTAEDNTTTQDYEITINEAEAPKSLSRVLFSNGFDAFIDNTNHTVKAYYLAGTTAPTATTITAGAGTAGELSEGKIRVTGADDSYVDYIVTLEAVTPNTATVAEEAAAGEFAGDEAWVKNGLLVYGNAAGYDGGDGKKWYVNRRLTKGSDPEDDQRVIAGWVRSYFFVGNASKFIMTIGGNKKLDYTIDGGTPVENVEVETLEIALTKGNHMIEIVSHQSSGDCRLSAPKLVELPPTFTVNYYPNGGSGAEIIVDDEATEVAAGTIFTAPASSIFTGWNTQADGNGDAYAAGDAVTADLTLFAQWETSYTVTFDLQGHGDAIDPQNIVSGGKVVKPADPSADAWEFGGWYKESTCENEWDFATDVVTTTTTIFAKWTADPCPSPYSLSKVVLTSASDGTVTGYNNNEYAGEKVIGGLNSTETAEVDPSHEGAETGYKLNSGGSAIVFATLKKGTFQVGDRVVVTITKAQDAYKVEEVAQPILDIYYGTDKNDATFLTTIENVTAAGTYTYRLTAADVTAIGNKKGIGVFRPSSGRTQNPYVYSVEIKGCREWAIFHTLTFKNIDGTATIAAESLEEGAYASTVAPVAPKIAMKRFLGWAEAIEGTPVELTSYTITEDKTLYAVYEDIVCPTNGTVYKFQLKTDLTTGKIFTSAPGELTLNTTDHLSSMVNGEVTVNLASGKNTNRVQFYDGKAIGFANGDGASITLTLDCALATGDEIRFINYAGNGNKMNLSDGTHSLELNGNSAETVQKITVNSDWNGADELTLTRGGNTPKLTYFEIYRPAKYTVSFDMMGHGTQIADIEDVIDGSKITAPTAPTDENYAFGGWYKENTLSNAWDFDNDVVSEATTLYAKWLDMSDATLKSLKYGAEEIALQAGVYIYDVELPALTTAVPALTAATSNPNASAVVADDAAFDESGNAQSTVTVTPQKEGAATQTYTVNFAKAAELPQVNVTGSTTWNFSAGGSTTLTNQSDIVLANLPGINNDANFNSQALLGSFNKMEGTYFQGSKLSFTTEVPGKLTITFRGTNNNARHLQVCVGDGEAVVADWNYQGSGESAQQEKTVFVPAGKVTLKAFEGETPNNSRIYNMIFNATPDYTRNVSNNIGTLCVDHNVPAGQYFGATFYQIASRNELYNDKIDFEEVLPNEELKAGEPYIFQSTTGRIDLFYGETVATQPSDVRGMYGWFDATAPIDPSKYDMLDITVENMSDILYISQNKLWSCENLVDDNLKVVNNRAYIVMSEVPTYEDYVASQQNNGAPRRRVIMGRNGEQSATGFENLNASEKPMKLMINGQIFILRGEKMFDATGRLVK